MSVYITYIDGVETITNYKKGKYYIELAILFVVQICSALGGFMLIPSLKYDF